MKLIISPTNSELILSAQEADFIRRFRMVDETTQVIMDGFLDRTLSKAGTPRLKLVGGAQ